MTASHSSSVMFTSIRSRRMPALLTRTWRSPNVSIAVLMRRWAPSHVETSSPLATASPPIALISSTTCCGRAEVAAGAVHVAAEVVDDDLGALAGQASARARGRCPGRRPSRWRLVPHRARSCRASCPRSRARRRTCALGAIACHGRTTKSRQIASGRWACATVGGMCEQHGPTSLDAARAAWRLGAAGAAALIAGCGRRSDETFVPAADPVTVLPGLAVRPRAAWGADLPPRRAARARGRPVPARAPHAPRPTATPPRSVPTTLRTSTRSTPAPPRAGPTSATTSSSTATAACGKAARGASTGPVDGRRDRRQPGLRPARVPARRLHRRAAHAGGHAVADAPCWRWLGGHSALDTSPGATTTFVSRGSQRWAAGRAVTTPTIAGHRDMTFTGCPGDTAVPGRARPAPRRRHPGAPAAGSGGGHGRRTVRPGRAGSTRPVRWLRPSRRRLERPSRSLACRCPASLTAMRADVVVVGAGPAGAAASVTAARAGLDVVLVDKARFPRDKCCGDGLTTGALRLLEELGLDPATVPVWQDVDAAWVRSPSGRVVDVPAAPRARAATPPSRRRAELDAALRRPGPGRRGQGARRPRRCAGGRRARPTASRSTSTASGRSRAPLRRRRRRHVVAPAQAARRRRARLPRRVARLPPVLPPTSTGPAGRRLLGVVRARPAARLRLVVPAARRPGQRRLRHPRAAAVAACRT